MFGRRTRLEISEPVLGPLRYKGGSIELRPPEVPYPGTESWAI